MALSIGVATGSKIVVGTDVLTVKQVVKPHLMQVVVNGKEFIVSDQARVEILPEVFVFAGEGPKKNGNGYKVAMGEEDRGSGYRLAFEAPRHIKIHRLG